MRKIKNKPIAIKEELRRLKRVTSDVTQATTQLKVNVSIRVLDHIRGINPRLATYLASTNSKDLELLNKLDANSIVQLAYTYVATPNISSMERARINSLIKIKGDTLVSVINKEKYPSDEYILCNILFELDILMSVVFNFSSTVVAKRDQIKILDNSFYESEYGKTLKLLTSILPKNMLLGEDNEHLKTRAKDISSRIAGVIRVFQPIGEVPALEQYMEDKSKSLDEIHNSSEYPSWAYSIPEFEVLYFISVRIIYLKNLVSKMETSQKNKKLSNLKRVVTMLDNFIYSTLTFVIGDTDIFI